MAPGFSTDPQNLAVVKWLKGGLAKPGIQLGQKGLQKERQRLLPKKREGVGHAKRKQEESSGALRIW